MEQNRGAEELSERGNAGGPSDSKCSKLRTWQESRTLSDSELGCILLSRRRLPVPEVALPAALTAPFASRVRLPARGVLVHAALVYKRDTRGNFALLPRTLDTKPRSILNKTSYDRVCKPRWRQPNS